jgi:hypothetical protein
MSGETKRTIKTEYYRPGKHKVPYKVTYGSNRIEVLPNITRNMMLNKYGADVAMAYDEEYGELLLVATYKIGERFRVVFEGDVHQPVLITDFPVED